MTGQPSEQEWDAVPPGSATTPYGAPPAPAYGPTAPYGPPPGSGYGYAPYPGPPPGYGWGSPPAWPAGPGRPGVATAAGVLGIVTGSLSALVALVLTAAVLGGEDDAPTLVLLLGLPCGVALVAAGIRLLGRHSPTPLFVSALVAVTVLFLALVVGAGTVGADGLLGLTAFLVFALPLPVLTAVFARLPATVGWAAARP